MSSTVLLQKHRQISAQLSSRLGSYSVPGQPPVTAGCALVALLRPVPPITLALLRNALGRFLGRWYLTYKHSSPGAVDPSRGCSCFLAGGYSVPFTSCYSTVSQFQAHLCGFLPWSRGPRARGAGESLHTGAILKALSAGGVSGSTLYNAPCRPVASQASTAGWPFVSRKLCSPSQT